MRFWTHISLPYNLAALIVVTSLVVLLVASVAFVLTELYTLKQTMVMQLRTIAELLSAESTAAVVALDEDAVRETLATLQTQPRILAATFYLSKGYVFAR